MKLLKYFILIFLSVFILFGIALYTIYSDVKEQTIQDLNISQTIHAQQAATGIREYVDHIISKLNFLSRFPEIIEPNDLGKRIMTDYQHLYADEVKGITRVDARGKIIYTAPSEESIGKDISDQAHIQLSMKTHKIVVSDVFVAVQGFRIVAVHVPVLKNGTYDGTIAFLLSFDKIAQKYIEDIHIGASGYAWVVSEKGIELSSPFPDHIGINVYDTYRDFPEIISMIDEMHKGNAGVTVYHYKRNRDASDEKVLKHAVYLPVSFGNTFWSIVVATPEDEALASLSGFRTKLLLITIGLLMICVICMYLIVRYQVIIGEQRKREIVLTALRESEQRFQVLAANSPVGIFQTDAKGSTIYVNPRWCEITGLSEEDASGTGWLNAVHSEDKEKLSDGWKKATEIYDSSQEEYRFVRKDGTTAWVIGHAIPQRNSKNMIVGYVGTITDITERKHAEEKTKQLTQQLLKAEEIAHFGFLDWNLITNEIVLSPEINRIYDIPEDVLDVADFITRVVHPDDLDFVNENLGLAVQGIKAYNIDHRIIRPNGKIVWLNAQAELYLDENEKPVRLLGTILDITGRKLIEEEIRKLNEELELRVHQRTAQLEAANKELEAFSYSVSHDLRAPLRHASGYVDLLIKRCKSDLSEKGQHYVSSIADSVHQMGMLIDELLQFSRSSRTEMRLTDSDMNEIVQEVMTSLRQDHPDRLIDWTVSELPSVCCDRAMLKLVWMNLLSNAVKFSRTRDRSKIEIGVHGDDNEYEFFVCDNGVGFDMQYSQKLFGVFQRLHSIEEFEGTGIGLANVRRIILRHEGRTWAEAKTDEGATFYFTLPKHKKEQS